MLSQTLTLSLTLNTKKTPLFTAQKPSYRQANSLKEGLYSREATEDGKPIKDILSGTKSVKQGFGWGIIIIIFIFISHLRKWL